MARNAATDVVASPLQLAGCQARLRSFSGFWALPRCTLPALHRANGEQVPYLACLNAVGACSTRTNAHVHVSQSLIWFVSPPAATPEPASTQPSLRLPCHCSLSFLCRFADFPKQTRFDDLSRTGERAG